MLYIFTLLYQFYEKYLTYNNTLKLIYYQFFFVYIPVNWYNYGVFK